MIQGFKQDYKARVDQIHALLFFVEKSNSSRAGRYSEEERQSIGAIIKIIESELTEIAFCMFESKRFFEERKLRRQHQRETRLEAKKCRMTEANEYVLFSKPSDT